MFERLDDGLNDFDPDDLSYVKRMAAIGDSYAAGIGAGDRLAKVDGFGDPDRDLGFNESGLRDESRILEFCAAQICAGKARVVLGLDVLFSIDDNTSRQSADLLSARANDLIDWVCSRYDHSYPHIIHQDPRLGPAKQRKFQFEACSGAVINDVVNTQLPAIDNGQQVILLSAGGNDAELTNVLNLCIFQWWAVENSALGAVRSAIEMAFKGFGGQLASKGLGWVMKTGSRTCEEQLTRSMSLINTNDFDRKLDNLIIKALGKLEPSGILYYTGYAKFWAESMSTSCDTVTWGVFDNFLVNLMQRPQYLTKERRMTMNRLVDQMNRAISNAVARTGPQVQFVDYDQYVGEFGGRYCENEVDEASTQSNTRSALMFYEMDLGDPLGQSPWKRHSAAPPDKTFEGTLDAFAQLTLALDPHATLTGPSSHIRMIQAWNSTESDLVQDNLISSALPDGYLRVFHPQILLHELIANLVIFHMTNHNTRNHGFDTMPERLQMDSCPYSPQPTEENTLQIALASYINPTTDGASWTIMQNMDKVSILVANVLNGPDSTVHEAWLGVIKAAHGKGKTVLGYVRTGYLGKSVQKFQTMLGSTDLADWIAQIETDVELWFKLYPGLIDGIFFDEGWNVCSEVGGDDTINADVYRMISENTKRRHPGAYTVLNPGTSMPQCFENSADTLLTFESNFTNYKYEDKKIWQPLGWDHVPKPQKIWHIVYDVPLDMIRWTADKARERGAGLVQITNTIMPNPYDKLPDRHYLDTFQSAVDFGRVIPAQYTSPRIRSTHPATYDIRIRINKVDYSSVDLGFDVLGSPMHIVIEQAGVEVARILGSMSRVTIGNLKPGTKGQEFRAVAVGPEGRVGGRSNTVVADTLPLPNGKAITNIKVTSNATMTIFEADVLLAFAFVRIHITDFDDECKRPAYDTATDKNGNKVCSHYMIEGQTSYSYAATEPDRLGNWPWVWTTTSPKDNDGNNMRVDRDVYHYTWYFPFGTDTRNTSNFIVQGDGFSERADAFYPCPSTWSMGHDVLEMWDATKSCQGDSGFKAIECGGDIFGALYPQKWCNDGINLLTDRNHKIFHSSRVLSEAGGCRGNRYGDGCSITIMGDDEHGKPCRISGDDLWNEWQILGNPSRGGCPLYGTKYFRNGCKIKADFMRGCGNTDDNAWGMSRLAAYSQGYNMTLRGAA